MAKKGYKRLFDCNCLTLLTWIIVEVLGLFAISRPTSKLDLLNQVAPTYRIT